MLWHSLQMYHPWQWSWSSLLVSVKPFWFSGSRQFQFSIVLQRNRCRVSDLVSNYHNVNEYGVWKRTGYNNPWLCYPLHNIYMLWLLRQDSLRKLLKFLSKPIFNRCSWPQNFCILGRRGLVGHTADMLWLSCYQAWREQHWWVHILLYSVTDNCISYAL